MGCHASKQGRKDLFLSPSLPRRKSLSDIDTPHVVSLTSCTLGSLNINSLNLDSTTNCRAILDATKNEVPIDVENARVWSNKINQIIPRTPTQTPPNEPEPIDAIELMAGFHGDCSPLDRRSFSFHPTISKPSKEECSTIAILYFTSLRGIRKTYEDCCIVKSLLKEYGARIEERDVSMHKEFKDELKGNGWSLPRVVVGSRDYGVEEIRNMHEVGKLGKAFEGCLFRSKGDQCEVCGDVRFVMCMNCHGSCRIYVDEEYEEEEEEEEEEELRIGWRRCLDCNENGIVRCPTCCL